MAAAWLARIPFAADMRVDVDALIASALPELRGLEGVQEVHVHRDLNDQGVVWAYMRLRSRDDVFAVYESAALRRMIEAGRPLWTERPLGIFLDEELAG